MRFVFLLAALVALIGMAGAVTVNNCGDGTPYGKCSNVTPGYYCTGNINSPYLSLYLAKCKCESVPGWVQEGTGESATCVPAKCNDGTISGQCSPTKPKVCIGGNTYIDNATKCGCPPGKKMSEDGLRCESPPCNDGGLQVPDGTCSPKKEKMCINGSLVSKASVCGCPDGMSQEGENCVMLCKDGTVDGQCSKEKPKECVNGYLIDNAAKCGCPSGFKPSGRRCVSGEAQTETANANSLIGKKENSNGEGQGQSAACCCLPVALIAIAFGFAFFSEKKA